MKAIALRAPGDASALSLERVDDPVPGPQQVVIEVAHCGVCCHEVVVRVDVVIDTVGTPGVVPTRRSLARGGRWVMLGQVNGDCAPFNPAQLFLKGIQMLSAISTTREALRQSLEFLALGTVRATIAATLPLADAAQAHRRVESGELLGRLTLSPRA